MRVMQAFHRIQIWQNEKISKSYETKHKYSMQNEYTKKYFHKNYSKINQFKI